MMLSYLSFVKGVVDSDDLPLNVSKEKLQQHWLLQVIKKKLVRNTLDIIKKISNDKYEAFWAEYSTSSLVSLETLPTGPDWPSCSDSLLPMENCLLWLNMWRG